MNNRESLQYYNSSQIEDKQRAVEIRKLITSNYLSSYDILYDMALAAGGRYFPFLQILDPLLGTRSHEGGKFDYDKGHCTGHVMSWAQRIASSGTPQLLLVVDDEAHDLQNTDRRRIPDQSITTYKFISETVESIADNIHPNMIYEIGLVDEISMSGHAIGIRRVPNSHMIELMDPNIGCLTFLDKEMFNDCFRLLLSVNCLYAAVSYTRLAITPLLRQRMDVVCDEYQQLITINSDYFIRHATRQSYETMFQNISTNYANGKYSKIHHDTLKVAFIENCLVRIKYTNDVDVLKWLASLFTMKSSLSSVYKIIDVIKELRADNVGHKLWNTISERMSRNR